VFRRRKINRDQTDKLIEAARSLEQARGDRVDQERKLAEENESVRLRFERLARGNHLAELALRALTERYDHGTS
jgi:hypothetical protein